MSGIRYLVEEMLAAGTLLPPPRRFAKPGPARAPRPPDRHTTKKKNTINLPRCHVTSCFLGKNCWNTDPSEPSWTDQLHQLVVAHVAQKVLQTAFAWRWHVVFEVLFYYFFLYSFPVHRHRLPPKADSSCPPPPLPRAPGMGGLLRYSFTLRQNSSSLSVFGSWG